MSSDAMPFATAVSALASGRTADAEATLSALDSTRSFPERSLAFHVRALAAAERGDATSAQQLLADAASLELEAGLRQRSLHSTHESALLAHGGLERAEKYYNATVETLTKMRNDEGLALCSLSLGELALVRGRTAEAGQRWAEAEQRFARCKMPEATLAAAWRALIA